MNIRICGRCGEEKPLEEFHLNKSRPLGRAYWCKFCTRENDRERNRRVDRQLYIKEWEVSDRGRQLRSERRKADRNANKVKYRAYRQINKLIHEGFIERMPCEICGELNGNGHHTDYTQPLVVVWLCPKHHANAHRQPIN